MNEYEAIKYISTPLALLAFIVAVLSRMYSHKLKNKLEIIKSIPNEDRAFLIDKELETYRISPQNDNLSEKQKIKLMQTVIFQRAYRLKILSITSICISSIFALTIVSTTTDIFELLLKEIPINSQERNNIISGKIIDGSNNSTISQALITIDNLQISNKKKKAFTEDNGNFFIRIPKDTLNKGNNRVRLIITKQGYHSIDRSITPPAESIILIMKKMENK